MLTKYETKKCRYCGKEFTTKRQRKVFCSGLCRSRNFQDSHLLVTLEQWHEYRQLKESSLRVDSDEVR